MFNLVDYEWIGRCVVTVIEVAFIFGIGILIMKRIIKAYYWLKKYFNNLWWK